MSCTHVCCAFAAACDGGVHSHSPPPPPFAFAFALGAGANCFITHFAASVNQKKRLGREYELQPQDLPRGVLQVQHV